MEKMTINLLILEDDPDDAEFAVKELEREGFTVEWSRVDTEKAYREALEKKPDLILSDYFVPSFSGTDALKMQQKIVPEIPLIITSGKIGEDTAVECVKSGAIDYVLKDNLSRLGPVVKRALKEVQEHQELRRVEKAFKESEIKYRVLFETAQNAIFLSDESGKFIDVNQKACKSLGYSKEELLRLTNRDIDADQTGYKAFQKIRNEHEKTLTFEVYQKKKDGTTLPVEITGSSYIIGRQRIFLAIARDISERKQAEDALRESEDRFRTLIEFSPFGISIMKPDRSFEYFNPKFTSLFGYTKDEIPDKQAWFEKAYPDEEYRQKVVSIWKEDLVEDVKIEEIMPRIVTVRCKNGQDKIIQFRSVVIKDGKHFLTYEDISAQVKAEEERKNLENQLQVAKKMESIATLAGGVAHEFNNALIGITGNIEFLNMDLPDDENVTKYTKSMKSSAHRMAHLTSQLLAYARGGKYQDKIVSLNDFVEDTLPLIKYNIKPDTRIETDLPKDILNVKVDLTQMQMVLSTILTNSDEALEGPGRIRITTTNEDIDDEFARTHPGLRPGRYVCLTIKDDGKGMDEEIKSKIFEPFFTTKFQGCGLGMAAVYGIVKNHGGWVSVESEISKGTTVRIYLPST